MTETEKSNFRNRVTSIFFFFSENEFLQWLDSLGERGSSVNAAAATAAGGRNFDPQSLSR